MIDIECMEIKDNSNSVEVNTTATRDHAGEMERGIWLDKEQS